VPEQRGTVLIIEDSHESASLLAVAVEGEGFRAAVFATAREALAAHRRLEPVAVLLDWGLPDGPGIEVCRQIRSRDSAVPIMFVSARDDETSIARGLDAGADDYITKPVRVAELMARLEAHLRRVAALREGSAAQPAMRSGEQKLSFGIVEIDFDAHQVRRSGRPVKLGPLEFKLLEYLARNAGTAVSRDQILSEVYGYNEDLSSERVDVMVRRLRSKLGETEAASHISAIPGYGYRLDLRGAAE
jgi:two-component system, OmpR family, phosphate regulon response regulator PhoB